MTYSHRKQPSCCLEGWGGFGVGRKEGSKQTQETLGVPDLPSLDDGKDLTGGCLRQNFLNCSL